LTLLFHSAFSQFLFSVATDVSGQHNFKKGQEYWSIGQTVQTHFNLTPREGIYVWFSYYSNGKYKDDLVAMARSSSTSPQTISYVNRSKMRLKQLSIGWKKYLIGSCDAEKGFNTYVSAGFGLVLGRIINTPSVMVSDAQYKLPVTQGQGNFKRLTIDPGIGIEHYLGGDVYMYGETRVWIPTTDYPSNYLFVNDDAPWMAMINLGFRVNF
jgi:hypothetical protein